MNFFFEESICRNVIMNITMRHPGREHTSGTIKSCAIDTQKRQDVGMLEVQPDGGFSTKSLHKVYKLTVGSVTKRTRLHCLQSLLWRLVERNS